MFFALLAVAGFTCLTIPSGAIVVITSPNLSSGLVGTGGGGASIRFGSVIVELLRLQCGDVRAEEAAKDIVFSSWWNGLWIGRGTLLRAYVWNRATLSRGVVVADS